MGEYDIIYWLKRQRDNGRHQAFTIHEVREAMRSLGVNDDTVGGTLIKLEVHQICDSEMSLDLRHWERKFKLNDRTWQRLRKMESKVDGKL